MHRQAHVDPVYQRAFAIKPMAFCQSCHAPEADPSAHPLTRKALKGHTEFGVAEFAETEDGGRHYFGAFVSELDLARKMASIVESKVPGSKPQVLCVKPRVVRRLKIDMRTGAVLATQHQSPPDARVTAVLTTEQWPSRFRVPGMLEGAAVSKCF
jgi:hypothetical protein